MLSRKYKLYTCNICGWSKKTQWSSHLRKVHNLTSQQYYDLHLKKENEGICFDCGKKARYDERHHYYNEYCEECFSMSYKERYDKYKKEPGEGSCKLCNKGTTWDSRGLKYNVYCDNGCYSVFLSEKATENINRLWETEEFQQIRKESGSRQCQKLHSNPEFKEAHRQRMKNRNNDPVFKQAHSERLRIRNADPVFKEKLSRLATERLLDPNDGFGTLRGNFVRYANVIMRSSWEAKFAHLCDQEHILWEFEPRTFQFDNGQRYTPDFYLPEYNIFVEIKPTLFYERAVEKLTKLRESHPNIKLLVVTEKDVPYFARYHYPEGVEVLGRTISVA